jgi:cytochrome c551/c552
MQGFAFKSFMLTSGLLIASLSGGFVFANTSCMACHQGETDTTAAPDESQPQQHDSKKDATQERATLE